MNTEPLGPELTAFALNDPSLTDAQKHVIEQRLALDPAARQLVEETRSVGLFLAENLAVKVELMENSPMGHTVAATLEKKRGKGMLPWWATALAACVTFCIGIMVKEGYAPYRAEMNSAVAKKQLSEARLDAKVRNGYPLTAIGNVGVDAADPVKGVFSPESSESDVAARKGDTLTSTRSGINPAQFGPNTGTSNFNGGFGGGGTPQGSFPLTSRGGFGGGQFQGGAFQGAAIAPNIPKPTPTVTKSTVTFNAPAEVNTVDPALPAFTGRGTTGYDQQGRDAYPQLIENAFTEVKGEAALSTFGVDVDTASYSIVRNYLNHNSLPPANAVRLEEMINYFPYKDAPPEGNDPFAVRVEMAECPWQPKHRLARIALKAKPIDNSKRPKSNLVFLIDVSGSMDAPNRLPLVKAAMKLLVGQLGENDRVAIVVYAGASGLVLDSTNCGNPDTILKALDNLTPGGSTNGASGIQLAYEVAVKNFVEKGTNRVILCTDGDWNVGTTSTDALIKLIEEKKKTGVFLSVFGFGMGNLRDEMMVQLAGKGNGNYGYIDSLAEAKKALVEQISGTLVTVAKDVKIQIEFNPARIASYRLIGYEKRILAAKDFADDKKDAGEMGAGHVVTALYELVPTEAAQAEPKVDGLRYQPKVEAPKAPADDKTSKEAFVLKLRHKMPDKDESVLREIPVLDDAKAKDKATDDFQFASAVAAFGMLLKNSQYKAQANYALVEELVAASLTNDPGAYRAEFLQLVKKAKALSGGK